MSNSSSLAPKPLPVRVCYNFMNAMSSRPCPKSAAYAQEQLPYQQYAQDMPQMHQFVPAAPACSLPIAPAGADAITSYPCSPLRSTMPAVSPVLLGRGVEHGAEHGDAAHRAANADAAGRASGFGCGDSPKHPDAARRGFGGSSESPKHPNSMRRVGAHDSPKHPHAGNRAFGDSPRHPDSMRRAIGGAYHSTKHPDMRRRSYGSPGDSPKHPDATRHAFTGARNRPQLPDSIRRAFAGGSDSSQYPSGGRSASHGEPAVPADQVASMAGLGKFERSVTSESTLPSIGRFDRSLTAESTNLSVGKFDRSVTLESTNPSVARFERSVTTESGSSQVMVKNTFIHVEDEPSSEDEVFSPSLLRSASAPLITSPYNSENTLQEEDSDDDDDESPPSAEDDYFPAKSTEPLPNGLASIGSELHGTGKCRPCAWFWKEQGCGNGAACRHCHVCPEGEIKRRRKAKVGARRRNHRHDRRMRHHHAMTADEERPRVMR